MAEKLKLYISPEGPFPANKPINGVQQVINAQYRWLPELGWEISSRKSSQLYVSHAGSLEGRYPDVAHCHGLYPTAEPDWPATMMHTEINARVIRDLRIAKKVIVPSQFVADLLRRDMHLEPEIIPHGLHLSDWPEPPERELPARPVLLWNKNRTSDVCSPKVLAALFGKGHPFCLWSTFAPHSGRPAAGGRVLGLLPHDQMKEILYQVHVYLALTKETFGIGTLEAMAAGLPVVAYDYGATPEVIGPAGVLVPPGDEKALLLAIEKVLDNYQKYSRLARERALQFPWERSIRAYDRVYRQALEPHPGPKVSVVIPCYNYAQYIRRALRSVYEQTFQDWECIVVDDGSTDGSLKAIHGFLQSVEGDSRFRVLTGPNRGVAYARNRGAREARGEYLVFLDADDAIAPNFLEVCSKALDSNRDLGLVYTGLLLVKGEKFYTSRWPGEFHFSEQVRGKNQVPTCNMMRKTFFERAGGFRQRFHPAEDAELWLRLGAIGCRMRKISEEPLFLYHFHERSASDRVRRGRAQEPNWRYDHPWTIGQGPTPFACILSPGSHPVHNYDRPQVSIVIPVGPGHKELVLQALDSVEAQTFPYWECIVVDDTLGQDFELPGRPWAKLLRTGGRKGPAHARNLGAKAAKAPLLLFLDADDFLHPPFLATTLEAWEPGFYVYTDRYDETGRAWPSKEFDEQALRHQALHTITFLHEKAVWESVGGFDEQLDGWEDWDYTIAIAASGVAGLHLPVPLVTYRTDAGWQRELSRRRATTLLPAIRRKWEGVPMGCCGKRPRTRRPVSRAAATGSSAAATFRPDPNLVLIRYTGNNMGSMLIRCPSGNRYRYGGRRRVLQVTAEDAAWLALRADFDYAEAPPVEPTPPESQTPSQGSAGKEDDDSLEVFATALRHEIDLSTTQVHAILSAGFRSLDDLRGKSLQELVSIPGVGQATAYRILNALKNMKEEADATRPPHSGDL